MFEPVAPATGAVRHRPGTWQPWKMGEVTQAIVPAQGDRTDPSDISPVRVHEPLSPLQPALLMDETELTRLRQMAHAAGHAEGWREGRTLGEEEGRAAGLAEARREADRLAALAQSLPRALADADAAMAADIVALAMSLARQVLGQSLALQPEAVLAAVRELLHEEPALTGQPVLRLHPDDAQLVQDHLRDELQTAGWRVRIDAQIERGGCRVQAASAEIDATLPTRWARLASLLGPPHG